MLWPVLMYALRLPMSFANVSNLALVTMNTRTIPINSQLISRHETVYKSPSWRYNMASRTLFDHRSRRTWGENPSKGRKKATGQSKSERKSNIKTENKKRFRDNSSQRLREGCVTATTTKSSGCCLTSQKSWLRHWSQSQKSVDTAH